MSVTNLNLTQAAPVVLARDATSATRATSWSIGNVNSLSALADVRFGEITGRLEGGAVAGASTLSTLMYNDAKLTFDGVISNGTLGSALNVTHTGNGTITLNAANAYTGTTRLQAKNTVVNVDAPAGQDGAFGNATSAVVLGEGSTVGHVAGLFAGDGVRVGRNLTVSGQNPTGVAIGALEGATAEYAGTIALGRSQTRLVSGVGSVVDFSGALTGGAIHGIVTQGEGTIVLSAANTYAGGTTVEAGRLRAASALALGASGQVLVAGGTLEVAPGVTLANNGLRLDGGAIEVNGVVNALDARSGTIGGVGTVNAPLALDAAADIVSPGGATVGTLTIGGDQTWTGLTYSWQAGPSVADRLNLTGTLALGGSYVLQIAALPPGTMPADETWTILTTTGGITGFDAADWTIDTTLLINPAAAGFALSQEGNALVLSMTSVPEPAALTIIGGLAAATLRRRRKLG